MRVKSQLTTYKFKGPAMIFADQENPFIIFRRKEI